VTAANLVKMNISKQSDTTYKTRVLEIFIRLNLRRQIRRATRAMAAVLPSTLKYIVT